jgi:hypothetical protein
VPSPTHHIALRHPHLSRPSQLAWKPLLQVVPPAVDSALALVEAGARLAMHW